MKHKLHFSTSIKIYWFLIFILSICSALNLFLPQGDFGTTGKLPASKPIMALAIFSLIFIFYGTLGFIGIILSRKLGFKEIWDKEVNNKKRFLVPFYIGIILGIILIIGDLIFSHFNNVGMYIHPPFPTSIIASISAGIGEELIFRLFFISFWVFILNYIFKGKYKNQIFFIISFISALLFSLSHIPAVIVLYNLSSPLQISPILYIEMILLNGLIAMFSSYYMRKYGYLAAIGIHFWTDIVWHVVYGLI